eukprot:8585466-Pyramimonas_sp.AAC.1
MFECKSPRNGSERRRRCNLLFAQHAGASEVTRARRQMHDAQHTHKYGETHVTFFWFQTRSVCVWHHMRTCAMKDACTRWRAVSARARVQCARLSN